MKILIISNTAVSSLFGRELPFAGFECMVEHKIPESGFADFHLVIDLSFKKNSKNIKEYQTSKTPVLIGSVIFTLEELDLLNTRVARFNNWPYFIDRNCIEFASTDSSQLFKNLFLQMDLPFFETKDITGFVSARSVSMIINEAYWTLQDEVSSKEEIDNAMKLGTSYPLGPFEWATKIGEENIVQLLQKLGETDTRYQPCDSLLKNL